jgi:hypothetical protein
MKQSKGQLHALKADTFNRNKVEQFTTFDIQRQFAFDVMSLLIKDLKACGIAQGDINLLAHERDRFCPRKTFNTYLGLSNEIDKTCKELKHIIDVYTGIVA